MVATGKTVASGEKASYRRERRWRHVQGHDLKRAKGWPTPARSGLIGSDGPMPVGWESGFLRMLLDGWVRLRSWWDRASTRCGAATIPLSPRFTHPGGQHSMSPINNIHGAGWRSICPVPTLFNGATTASSHSNADWRSRHQRKCR